MPPFSIIRIGVTRSPSGLIARRFFYYLCAVSNFNTWYQRLVAVLAQVVGINEPHIAQDGNVETGRLTRSPLPFICQYFPILEKLERFYLLRKSIKELTF